MSTSGAATSTAVHPLAELYGRWALNSLVDIAHALAHDVALRPQSYRSLSADVVSTLSDFRFKLGTDPEWPNAFQRTLNFKVLLQVCLAAPPVRAAALELVRHGGEQRDDRLLDAFRDAANAFRAHLRALEGQALAMTSNQTRVIFERAVRLFQDDDVARAFGLPAAPKSGWPLAGSFDGGAAFLVGQMVGGLRESTCFGGFYKRMSADEPIARRLVPPLTVSLPPEKFIKLQQAAHWGSLTISHLLDPKSDAVEPAVVDYAYKWTMALQRLLPDVERAWKDLEYRSRLTDLEWSMAPNPAGNTTPVMIGAAGGSTYTVAGEICCCSGDLDCDPTAHPLTDPCSEFVCTHVCTSSVIVLTDAGC